VNALRKDMDPFDEKVEQVSAELPNLSTFYIAEGPEDRLEELAEKLRKLSGIDGAYLAEAPVPPVHEVSIPSHISTHQYARFFAREGDDHCDVI
jgi:hypothetical protein